MSRMCRIFALLAVVVAGSLSAAQQEKRRYAVYRSFKDAYPMQAEFRKMGVSTRAFSAANTLSGVGGPYCDHAPMWLNFGEYDFRPLDENMEGMLKASPDERFIVLVDLNAPQWLVRRSVKFDSFDNLTHAVCNPDYIAETKKWMLEFLAHCEKMWGAHVDAYVLMGGCTTEWYERDLGVTSTGKNAAWRRWCEKRGLRFGPSVPDQELLRRAAFENLVYDPVAEADKIAYWRFHNSLPADAILEFASAARKALPREREIGTFFGYFLVSDGHQVSFGHLDYSRVFASPDIDFFIAPGNYTDRAIGAGCGSQLVLGSARLAGKRCLHEIDFWPHGSRWNRHWKTVEDDLAGNTREWAFAAAHDMSHWWFDMWGGFYDDPRVRARIAKLEEIQKTLVPAPSVAEILYVVDPESLCHMNENDPKFRQFVYDEYNQLLRVDAPSDVYSFDDLGRIDFSRYRLVVMNSTVLITPERAKLLRERVCRDGRTVVWSLAPGVTDGRTLDKARVTEWAGIPFGTPGISVTDRGGWRSVYGCDYRLFTAEKFGEIAAEAGVHRYLGETSPVFANGNFLAVHVKDGGRRTVRLPKRARRVTDLLTGETVATDADSFVCDFAAPDTRVFRVEAVRRGEETFRTFLRTCGVSDTNEQVKALVAAEDLLAYNPTTDFPYADWRRRFVDTTVAAIGGDPARITAAFERTWPDTRTFSNGTDPDFAIRKAVKWFALNGSRLESGTKGLRLGASLLVCAAKRYKRPEWAEIGLGMAKGESEETLERLADGISATPCNLRGQFLSHDEAIDGAWPDAKGAPSAELTAATALALMASAPPRRSDVTVFKAGTRIAGRVCEIFRIPALATATNGDLVAVADARWGGHEDLGVGTSEIEIAIARSTDRGRTWSAPVLVWDWPFERGARWAVSDPSLVTDRTTGEIVLLQNAMNYDEKGGAMRRTFVQSSADCGRTWSKPREITASIREREWAREAFVNVASASGRQLRDGTLVFMQYNLEQHVARMIVSHDHGRTFAPQGGWISPAVDETKIVELADGRLFAQSREWVRPGLSPIWARLHFVSDDRGGTWRPVDGRALTSPACNGDILRVLDRDGQETFVVSYVSGRTRQNVSYRISRDGLRTWEEPVQLWAGPSAYSTLTEVSPGGLGVAYECGDFLGHEGINFRFFELTSPDTKGDRIE